MTPIEVTNKMLQTGVLSFLEGERRTYPQYTHRASSIGHPCERFLYLSIHDWDKAAPISASLQGIMKTGQTLEDILISIFNQHIGPKCQPRMRIISTQEQIRDKLLESYRISGTCDGVLQVYDDVSHQWENAGLVDLKTCSSNLFGSYTDLESLRRHTWSSLYASQVMVYSFAKNLPVGYLMFVGKGNLYHDWKIIRVPVDFAHVETLLQKCASVNASLDNSRLPLPAKINQPMWCSGCRFESVCMPEVEYSGEGPKINDNEAIEFIVKRLRELKPLTREYDDLQKQLKGSLIPGQDLILKDAMVRWKQVTGNRQPCAGGPFTYWKMSMVSTIDSDDNDE
jgi:hypothetical protein